MEEVNAKDIEIVEKKKAIDPVKNENSEEDASVLVDANKKILRQQTNDLLSSIESNISYRKNVGCHGTSILCLNLFLIGFTSRMIYILYVSNFPFKYNLQYLYQGSIVI